MYDYSGLSVGKYYLHKGEITNVKIKNTIYQ